MAQCVVDLLEVVEVQAQNSERCAAFDVSEMVVQLFAQQCTICQSSQRIVIRQVFDALVRKLTLRNVLVRGDPSAARQWLGNFLNGTPIRQRNDLSPSLSLPDTGNYVTGTFLRIAREQPNFFAVLVKLLQRASRCPHLRIHIVNFDVAGVAKNYSMLRIEHHESLRHVAYGGLRQQLLFAKLLFSAAAFGDILKDQDQVLRRVTIVPNEDS